VQGFFGGLASAVMRAINKSSGNFASLYDKLLSKMVHDQVGQISGTFVSLGIAILTGLFVFIFINFLNVEDRTDYYHDKAHWIVEDFYLNKIKEATVPEEQVIQAS
jgi:hypothetical protein